MGIIRRSKARWTKGLSNGAGEISVGKTTFSGAYSFSSRFENGRGTNPEELLAAAHAACYSMELAAILERNGYKPGEITTESKVHLDKVNDRFEISKIELETAGSVPGINDIEFDKFADEAKFSCIISRALAAVSVELKSSLKAELAVNN